MWQAAGAVIAGLVLMLAELPALRNRKHFKEMAAYVILITAGTGLYALQCLHVAIPNPLDWIESFYEMLGLVRGR